MVVTRQPHSFSHGQASDPGPGFAVTPPMRDSQ